MRTLLVAEKESKKILPLPGSEKDIVVDREDVLCAAASLARTNRRPGCVGVLSSMRVKRGSVDSTQSRILTSGLLLDTMTLVTNRFRSAPPQQEATYSAGVCASKALRRRVLPPKGASAAARFSLLNRSVIWLSECILMSRCTPTLMSITCDARCRQLRQCPNQISNLLLAGTPSLNTCLNARPSAQVVIHRQHEFFEGIFSTCFFRWILVWIHRCRLHS